jgi:hypothetical protein
VLLFSQLPLAGSLKRRSSSDVGIEHVALIIGDHNRAPPPFGRDFNYRAKKPAIHGSFGNPLLADSKSLHLSDPPKFSEEARGVIYVLCLAINHYEPLSG